MRHRTNQRLRIYIAALSILLAVPLTAWCQQNTSAPAEVLTLDQAINVALQNNHGIKNALLAAEKSDEEIAATRTARLPSFHFYSLVSQDLVKHEVNVANPVSGLFPGIGPFFTL